MTAIDTPQSSPPAGPDPLDVWSRTQPKYRRRAIIFMCLTFVLFAGLGTFAFWLRSGVAFAPLMHDYWRVWLQSFNPFGEQAEVSLSELLLYPIHLEQVPMQIVVVGLLLASLTSVPILVAILYRFPASLVCSAIVAFFAILPWLALCGALGAWIASSRRITFRYASATLGMLPVVVYFIVVSQQDSGKFAASTTPAQQVMLYYPWLIALIGAAAMMGLVLTIARIVNYRPGAIAPVLAVMFAIPWIIFETEVGRDELYYRLLERRYGPASGYFEGGSAEEAVDAVFDREIRRDPDPQRDRDAVRQNVKIAIAQQLEGGEELGLLAQRRYEVIAVCDSFRASFPTSRYIPNILYIKGMAQDSRVDISRFMRDSYITFYYDFPSHVSFDTWAAVLSNFPKSPVADVAAVHIAALLVREGRVDDAIEQLERFRPRDAADSAEARARATGLIRVLEKRPAEETLNIPTRVVVSEGRRLLDLLVKNRDTVYGDEPLVEFFKLDPRSGFFAANMERLRRRFPECRLEDNLILADVLSTPDEHERITKLESLLRGDDLYDARPAAVFALATLLQGAYRPADARARFEELTGRFGDTPWGEDARYQLEQMERLTQATTP